MTLIAAARPHVIDEVFDGEAVLVQLRTGVYYSLSPAATAAWRLLADGRRPRTWPPPSAASATSSRPSRPVLLAEGLAVPSAAEAGEPPAALRDVPAGAATVQRFDDMQDLLLLDPIHDIDRHLDGAGWPVGRHGTPLEPAG